MCDLNDDLEKISWARGIYLGLLDEDELDAFYRCKDAGLVYESFSGPAGLLGLGKIEFRDE